VSFTITCHHSEHAARQKNYACQLTDMHLCVVGSKSVLFQELYSLVLLQVYSSQGSMMFDIKDQTWTAQHMQQLKSLLEDTSVVKVLYDAGAAAAVLFHWEGLAIRNVFDIQVTPSPSPVTLHLCVQFCCTQILPARSFSLCTEYDMSCRFHFGCIILCPFQEAIQPH